MPASAAFHFDAQASLLKKSIAASGTTTATADSVNGIESGSWTVVAAYGSLTSDWALSSATKTSVVVTAPSGSGKSCLLEYRVNGGGPTDPRTGQPTNGELVKRAKIYISPETIVPGETTEGDSTNGWASLFNQKLITASANELQGDSINIKDDAGDVHISVDVASDRINFKDELASLSIGWEQRGSGVGKTTTFKGQRGSSGNVGGVMRIGGGDGGTGGTNLAGAVQVDLGRTVSNASAVQEWVTNTGGADTQRLYFQATTSAGTVRLGAANDSLDIQSAAGALTIEAYGGVMGLTAASWIVMVGRWNDNNVVTPAQWTANTDNFALTTAKGVYRVSSDAARDLTGIVAPAFVGDRIRLFNVGAFTITLKHDATSTAANRFYLPGNVDKALIAGACAVLWYDGTSSRWRLESIA